MKRLGIFLTCLMLAALIVFIAGCSDDAHDITGNNSVGSPKILSVSPADESTNVPIGSLISIKFDMAMDSLSVMNSFYFSGGDDMHDWMDSLNFYQNMGGMGNMMDMDHMMDWMDSIHISGEFQWNESMDSCQFTPGTMMSNTEYLIYMNGDIMSQDSTMMDMSQIEYDSCMFRFTTGE